MRRRSWLLLWLGWLVAGGTGLGWAGEGRLLKVLPHWIDQSGRSALHPSLFERDAYQAHLRQNRHLVGGRRFDIHWQGRKLDWSRTVLRVECRTERQPSGKPLVIEAPARRPRWSRAWSALILDGPAFRDAGDVQAWRVSLWEGDREVASQASFLW